jgi:hypothetical protein
VARAIDCNVRTVSRLRQRYREREQTTDRPRSGKPLVTTHAQDRVHPKITPAAQVQDNNNNCPSYTRNTQSLHQGSECPQ